ncbi:MAG: tRNA (adenosine(37)-N6)-threonylcarbamoyltransferase complex dimerization subunit type 1 TsaB [Bdellovibrionales bacterium]
MILLSVDTSGTKGSLALARIDQGRVSDLQQVEWTKKAMHSEVATVELEKLLAQTKVELRALTHLVVNVGPGSFTGLRVGISLVKTLAYSLALPVCSINTLESLAFSKTKSDEKVFVATKAVQNFFYAASFLKTETGLQNLLPPQPIEDSQLADLSAGCTKVLIEGKTAGFEPVSEARHLVELLVASGFSQTLSDWKTVEPLYLRASEAEEKLKKGLLKPV